MLRYAAVLGLFFTLAFAPFNIWPLGLGALAGLWWLAQRQASLGGAAKVAFVFGFVHQVTALYWLPLAFYKDADFNVLAGLFGGVPALIGLAAYGALVPVLAVVAGKKVPQAPSVAFVVTWAGLEVLKSLTAYGFPWLPTGIIWVSEGPLGGLAVAQLASVVGVWGLSLFTLSVAAMLATLNRRIMLAALAMVAVVAIGGTLRVAAGATSSEVSSRGIVRLVQPNITSPHKWDPVKRSLILDQTLNTAFQPTGGKPDMYVMPETAVAFYLNEDPALRQHIAQNLMPGQTILTGTIRREVDDPETPFGTRYFNSITTLNAQAETGVFYDKQYRVPFGEFIPLRDWLDKLPLPAPVRTLSQSRLDFQPGQVAPRLQTPLGDAMPLICYEGIFPLYVAQHSGGMRMLVNVTNDNWFTGTTALYQHAALAKVRAIETGLPLVRVANTGYTLVANGYGQTVASLPTSQPAVLDVLLPLPLPVPPFAAVLQSHK